MIDTTYRFSLRLISETIDFNEMIPKIDGLNIIYHKKNSNLFKDSYFKVNSNILVIHDFFSCSTIDNENTNTLVNKIDELEGILSVIKVNDLKRELYIKGSIENQQFGFSINTSLINILSKYNYAFSFSGISYL